MIHICYSLFDRDGTYSKFVGTSILSMFENTHEQVTIHLIHDSTLTDENRKKFMRLVLNYDQDIIFHNVESRLDEIRKNCDAENNKLSIAALYRLLIPELLSKDISRAIYLDSDTLVDVDIKDLWSIDMQNYPLAAVPEYLSGQTQYNINTFAPVRNKMVDLKNYFNTGILLFDLRHKYFMEGGQLLKNCLEILKNHPEFIYLDQDALNVIFNENYLKLPAKFNRFVLQARWSNIPLQREILHYLAQSLESSMQDPFNRLWFKYFWKTPFCTEKTFENIFNSIQKLNDEKNLLWTKILKLSSTRQKILLMNPNDKWILDLFAVSKGDIIFNAGVKNILQIFFETMQRERGRKIFLIHINRDFYKSFRRRLLAQNFVENEDFFNVEDFLINSTISYDLVNKM